MRRYPPGPAKPPLLWLLGVMSLVLVAQPAVAQRTYEGLQPPPELSIIEEKNLFHPDRIPQGPSFSPGQPSPGPLESQHENFVLHGVIIPDKGRPIALIEEPNLTEKKVKSFSQGERIGPYLLKTVKKDRVVLDQEGREFEVILYKPREPPPAPTKPARPSPSPSRRPRIRPRPIPSTRPPMGR